MKRVFLITCIMIFTAAYLSVSGQDFSINVNSEPVSVAGGTDGEIEVTIEQGEPGFKFFLYDNEPWQGGGLLKESDPVLNDIYVFEHLPAGRYFAGAIDNSGKSTFKEVFIHEPGK